MYTILFLFTVTPAWLRLTRQERTAFRERVLEPIFAIHASVEVQAFDAEAFSASCSDFLILRTPDLQAYYHLMEALRDTEMFTVPYLEVKDIIIGLQDGYQRYEEKYGAMP
ncbi:darcynin family protein [Deinococcus cellulosilyticus]|uniref:Darcynin 1 n=1 Tax=Deinococcus cellulosilyticus (strain DSM 18568 / NBRC 106333 / KACC 11606 / 5516J-15) TaxID=1223518 RepID=A0A511N3X1_DEIC1|nr:darcynin family protein [Deinococcus cellulosilyticus]GEM47532.1 hypothetical protein DC3_31670 [Deinococcus cellulosilyticus NBRC 106333 = KACC 11606]